MASLYEINQSILACVDGETGEIIDAEALDSLLMQKNEKIEGVVLWIKNLLSDAQAYKAEKEAFAKREKEASEKAESLKQWLSNALDGSEFSTTKCAVSFRKSTRLDVLDADSIPKEFMLETVTVKPDKNAIKDFIKSGHDVSGCRLFEVQNPQIK